MLVSLGESPEEVIGFHACSYHFIDDRTFIPKAQKILCQSLTGIDISKKLKPYSRNMDGKVAVIWG